MTLDFQTFDSLTVPADSSAAAQIAAALPHSAVLKAFNTNFAATLAAGTTGEAPATVLIAGDNTQAKALLADVVTAAGLRAIDAGALRRARELRARSPDGGCAAGVAMLLEVPLVVLLGPVERGRRGDLSDDLPPQRLLFGVT